MLFRSDDVNDFHLLCLEDARTDHQTFNLGSGQSHSIQEVYLKIAELLDSKTKPVYKPDLPGEAFETLADITRAKKIGWAPKVGLKEGLRSSVDFIRREMEMGRI